MGFLLPNDLDFVPKVLLSAAVLYPPFDVFHLESSYRV